MSWTSPQPLGRLIARNLGSVAQYEVEQTRKFRIRSPKKAQAADDGKYRGGPRPYGFEADGVTVRENEALVIREATTSILASRSLGAVARELE